MKKQILRLLCLMAVLAAVLPAGIRAEAAVSDFASSISSRRVGIASLRDAALSRNSRYRFLQGSCTDGTYGYFLLGDRNYRNSCAVVKIRLSDWRIKKVRTGLPLHHGNDMTYNKKTKRLMVLHGAGELCCLVKPLFEIDDAEARRTGVIADDRYAPLLRSLIDDVNAMPGTAVRAVTHSSVTGNAGTREFFLHVVLGEACGPIPEEAIAAAVERARALEQYKKT